MPQINLLRSLPQANRDIKSRQSLKTPEIVAESKKFGEMYFDGPRAYGYGGYTYDGRWLPVAKDIITHYQLKPGMKVLDVGCAKGFLVKDLMAACPGLEVFGVDVSAYAIEKSEKEIRDRLRLASADNLPFPDRSFDLILAINSIHNLKRDQVLVALKEMQRASNYVFIQVDAYESEEQKVLFEEWVLTAEFHGYPEEWLQVFKEAGYTGDYNWTILEG